MEQIQLLLFAGMFIVMYFFFIRPQSQKIKEGKKFVDSLEKGTKVVTTGGIYGIIDKVEDNSFLVEIDKNVKVRIDKSGISADLTKDLITEIKAA